MTIEARRTTASSVAQGTAVAVLAAISVCHMLNDVIQSLIVASYPILKQNFNLDFRQIGLITFTFTFTASVFHPDSSRVARLASGGRHGLAQSVFQVGGNFGTALGPLLAAFIVLPYGQ